MTSFQRTFRLAALAALLASGALAAQETAASEPESLPKPTNRLGTRFINAPTPFTVGSRHRFELLFTHRFLQPVQDGDEHNRWGLDSGADIGIGVTYGATDHFDLAVYRSSFQENYELSAKYLIAEQSPHVPLSVGVRLGADLLLQENVEDADRPFAQLLLAREFAPGVSLVLSPSWVHDTPRLRDAFN